MAGIIPHQSETKTIKGLTIMVTTFLKMVEVRITGTTTEAIEQDITFSVPVKTAYSYRKHIPLKHGYISTRSEGNYMYFYVPSDVTFQGAGNDNGAGVSCYYFMTV